jgi:Sulfotransferase domain
VSVPVIAPDRFLLIIGAMKSATTSLFSYLAEHPAIAPSSVKEPEFFSRHQGHRHPVAAYEDLWEDFDPERHRFAMEASTGYTKWGERGAEETIHAHGLRPKLIYIVRDPYDRIESHYNFMLQNPAWRRDIMDPTIVQTSNYYLYVEAFSRVFGRENLLLLDYDEISGDAQGTVNRACAFLGLDPLAEIGNASARNVTSLPKSGIERAILRMAPAAAARTPEALKRPIRRAFARMRPGKASLTPAQRRRVGETLGPDMTRLAAEFGLDVGKWGF